MKENYFLQQWFYLRQKTVLICSKIMLRVYIYYMGRLFLCTKTN